VTRAAARLWPLLLLAAMACGRRDPTDAESVAGDEAVVEAPELDGLRASLVRDLDRIARGPDPTTVAASVVAAWQVPARRWPTLVTAGFRPHHAAYAAAFAAEAPSVAAALVAARATPSRAIEVRWQYADDPRLTGEQARLRIALPVGRPGAIVVLDGQPLAPVFAHDGQRWRALLALERVIVDRLAADAPDCVAPYQAAHDGPCLAMSAPILEAALAGARGELARACLRLRLNPCER
jgi:hypothetical protein